MYVCLDMLVRTGVPFVTFYSKLDGMGSVSWFTYVMFFYEDGLCRQSCVAGVSLPHHTHHGLGVCGSGIIKVEVVFALVVFQQTVCCGCRWLQRSYAVPFFCPLILLSTQ